MKQIFKVIFRLAVGLSVIAVWLVVPTCIGSIVIHPPILGGFLGLEVARFVIGVVSVIVAAAILRLAWGIGADAIK